MMQVHPVPDVDARDGLPIERMSASSVALLGSRERANQIQLRAGIDHPAHAAQNSIHFSKRSETIDINGLQAGGLRQQFFVQHFDDSPHWWKHHLDTTLTSLQQFCDAHIQNVIGRSA
jgi:hypothetical protein